VCVRHAGAEQQRVDDSRELGTVAAARDCSPAAAIPIFLETRSLSLALPRSRCPKERDSAAELVIQVAQNVVRFHRLPATRGAGQK
jgi:hypothetical protein